MGNQIWNMNHYFLPAGPEVDDREDISEGELVTGSDTELPPDEDNIQTEDQSYRETVRGVRSYMGWDFIPDLESSATSSSDSSHSTFKRQREGWLPWLEALPWS